MSKITSSDSEGYPMTYTANSFHYKKIVRSGMIGIYALVCPDKVCKHPDRIRCYEVIILRKRPQRVINGKVIAEGYRLPDNEDFGKYGWNYTTIEIATKKYNELLQRGC